MSDPGLSAAAAAALEVDPHALGEYLGIDVSCTSIKITKAGDGLSKQLDIEPRLLMPGERVHVLLEAIVSTHTHKPVPKANSWELVQTLEAQTVTFVDGDDVQATIRMAADRVARAAEARAGVTRLPGTDADDLESELGDPDESPPGQPEAEWDDD